MIYILILLAGAAMSILGPWWIICPIAFIICRWKSTSAKQAFWSSSLSFLSLWLFYALFLHWKGEVNMVNKMAGILTGSAEGLGDFQNYLLIIGITCLISFSLGGLSGLAGHRLKSWL